MLELDCYLDGFCRHLLLGDIEGELVFLCLQACWV